MVLAREAQDSTLSPTAHWLPTCGLVEEQAIWASPENKHSYGLHRYPGFHGGQTPVGRVTSLKPTHNVPKGGTGISTAILCTHLMTKGLQALSVPHHTGCSCHLGRGNRQWLLGGGRSLSWDDHMAQPFVQFVICTPCHHQAQAIINQWPQARGGLLEDPRNTRSSSHSMRGWGLHELTKVCLSIHSFSQTHIHTLSAAAHAVESAVPFLFTSGWHLGTFPPI